MKPLYWNRIQIPLIFQQANEDAEKEKVIWEDLDDIPIEEDEFDRLFSRNVVKPKPKEEKKVDKPKSEKPASIIDSKRSQNIGILLRSTHLDISRIEEVIYQFELSVDAEVLQQVQEVQATPDELDAIRAHTKSNPEKPLDTPDQFLLDLAGLSFFNERITCIMFQTKFSDAMAEIENRLNNIRSCCDFLTTSLTMKNMFAVTLACGNYMNGGNRQRGQADGFSIEILPKIKDVKSNTNTLNLLAYIVRFCILKFDENRGTQEAKLPVPEPSDLEKCQHIDFEVERGECGKVKRQLEKAKASTTKIFEKSPEELKEPFNTKMVEFVNTAEVQLADLIELVEDCEKRFVNTMKFYKFMPKKGKVEEAKPADFFCLWYPFCNDYKNLWKKEQVRIQKELLKEERQRHKKKKESLQNVEIKKTPVGGLKAKLQRRKTQSSAMGASGSPLVEDKVKEGDGEVGGLKAKLMKRKAKSASAASGSSEIPGTSSSEEKASLKTRLQRRSKQHDGGAIIAEETSEPVEEMKTANVDHPDEDPMEQLVGDTEALSVDGNDAALKDDPDFF